MQHPSDTLTTLASRLAFALACMLACVNTAWAWNGLVEYVVDGDTLHVRAVRSKALHHVRIIGIDAPEICQTWGPQSRQALTQLVLHQKVEIKGRARDDYGRLLARVAINGHDVGAAMVQQGHAWSYRWRTRKGHYDAQETEARTHNRGLFSTESVQRPGDFRRQHGSCYPGR